MIMNIGLLVQDDEELCFLILQHSWDHTYKVHVCNPCNSEGGLHLAQVGTWYNYAIGLGVLAIGVSTNLVMVHKTCHVIKPYIMTWN